MYVCEVLYGKEQAARVREGIKAGLGLPQCICEGGGACPLLPADINPLLQAWDGKRQQAGQEADSGPLTGPVV